VREVNAPHTSGPYIGYNGGMPVTIAIKRSELPFTYRDYVSWPDDERWELIDGVAYDMCAAPSRYHQDISMVLSRRIGDFFFGKPCRAYHAPFDVILPDEDEGLEDSVNVVQPDLVVICDERKLVRQGCLGPPDLVVEIISPYTSQKDQKEKFELYERAGVREYWIVHPGDRAVAAYVRGADGKFGIGKIFEWDDRKEGQTVDSSIFPELSIELRELFER